MRGTAAAKRLPAVLRRQVIHFECAIEDALDAFAAGLPDGARILDAGCGESQYRRHFSGRRYVGVDLAVGDAGWNYSGLDTLADLAAMPFPDACFDAAVHIVTLEHVPEPGNVLKEIARVLRSGAPLLLAAPQEWQIHQAPHDYYRYTRYGIRYLLEQSGFEPQAITPAGGFFRLLSRRLMDSLRFFPAVVKPLVALLAGPPALLLPLLEPLDREKNFTLGYLCTAHKR